ncbi:MAG: serine hydrolase domain-containing protein [Ferruginibacter sp.]
MAYTTRYNCRKFSLIAAFLLFLQFVQAQDKNNSREYDFTQVDAWLEDNISDLGGRAVLVILKDGQLLYEQSFNNMKRSQKAVARYLARRQGKSTEEAVQDFSFDTRERIASCSKWLSAALVMTFVDDGSLQLEDTLGKFLPVLSANGKGNITIWQCLSHLTGIKAGNFRETQEMMKEIHTMDEAIIQIARQPMEGPPGKTFHYSSAGLQLAAAVIEKISGKDFETLFAERIARPCGMTNTDFGHGAVPLPAGGGWSTAEDYIRFLNMILHDGLYNGRRVLSAAAVAAMQKNRVAADAVIAYTPAEAGNWGYGFGEWVMDDATGDQRSAAVTSPGLFGSFPWIDRNRDYAAFLFTFNIHSKGRNDRYKKLKSLVDEALNN